MPPTPTRPLTPSVSGGASGGASGGDRAADDAAEIDVGIALAAAVVVGALLLLCKGLRRQRAQRRAFKAGGGLARPLLAASPLVGLSLNPLAPGKPAPTGTATAAATAAAAATTDAPATVVVFSPAQLRTATTGYSQKLGKGAFGAVYGGVLSDGRRIAVKQAQLPRQHGSKYVSGSSGGGGRGAANLDDGDPSKYAGEEGFRLELEVLSKYRHPHLVALFGHCIERAAGADRVDRFSLVLEFMPGGSLLERLRPASSRPPLPARQRFEVAAHVVRALHYLHAEASPPLIHQDVKSDNVLLAERAGGGIVAKVADFGTARIMPQQQRGAAAAAGAAGAGHHSTKLVIGTTPYMPPEYLQLGRVSEKTDTYAFGVVLLELLTGKPPSAATADGRALLAFQVAPMLRDPEALLPALLDHQAGAWPKGGHAVTLARIAARCLEQHAPDRCTIRAVLGEVVSLAASVQSGGHRRVQSGSGSGVNTCKLCGARLRSRQGVALACFACKQ